MAAIFITCPVTEEAVATGIEADRHTLTKVPAFKSRIHCPDCGQEHEWSQADAWFREPDGSITRWPAAC
jgi:hypothetical protein